MAEFARETGISKKNLSRWANDAVDRQRLNAREHAEDGRVRIYALDNPERASRHLPAVAEVLGVPLDPLKKR